MCIQANGIADTNLKYQRIRLKCKDRKQFKSCQYFDQANPLITDPLPNNFPGSNFYDSLRPKLGAARAKID